MKHVRAKLLKLLLMLICQYVLCACELTDKAEKTDTLDERGLFSANLSKHYALIGTLSGHAELWQIKPKVLMHQWQHRDDSDGVIALDISSKEIYAVTAERHSIAWWRLADGTLLSVWSLPNIYSVSLSADGQYALIGLSDKAIYLSLHDGMTRYIFPHDDSVLTVDLSASGRYALTGSEDHSAKLWNLSNGKLIHDWRHDNQLSTVVISDSDRYALTSAALSQVRLWTLPSGKRYKSIGSPRVTLSSAAFSHDDKYLLTGHLSQLIELWNTETGNRLKFWRAKKKERWRPTAATILSLSFNDNDQKFYSIAGNGFLQHWSIQ